MTPEQRPGNQLTDAAEVLRRVVPLGKDKNGLPARDAFMPDIVPAPTKSAFMPGSDGTMSTHQECMSARDAYEEYVKVGDRAAIGTWGVSVGECTELELSVYHDGLKRHPMLPAGEVLPATHVSVWFPSKTNEVSNSRLRRQRERIAKDLCDFAIDRDYLYIPAS